MLNEASHSSINNWGGRWWLSRRDGFRPVCVRVHSSAESFCSFKVVSSALVTRSTRSHQHGPNSRLTVSRLNLVSAPGTHDQSNTSAARHLLEWCHQDQEVTRMMLLKWKRVSFTWLYYPSFGTFRMVFDWVIWRDKSQPMACFGGGAITALDKCNSKMLQLWFVPVMIITLI